MGREGFPEQISIDVDIDEHSSRQDGNKQEKQKKVLFVILLLDPTKIDRLGRSPRMIFAEKDGAEVYKEHELHRINGHRLRLQ